MASCLPCHRENMRKYYRTNFARPRTALSSLPVAKCKACGKLKPVAEFSSVLKNGVRVFYKRCKECYRVAARERYARDPARNINHVINRIARRRGAAAVESVDRYLVFERDNYTCYLCCKVVKKGDESLDHVVPLTRGGTHTYDNLRLAHRSCNSRKGARLLSELDWYQGGVSLPVMT